MRWEFCSLLKGVYQDGKIIVQLMENVQSAQNISEKVFQSHVFMFAMPCLLMSCVL